MTDLVVSFQDVTIRVPNEGLFSGINFEVKKGEHWAFVGDNETLKAALVEALAGNATVVSGAAGFPFVEKYRASHQNDPFLSGHRFVAKISDRHHFRNLSNTTQFYYQQRFNSSDSEDAMTVLEYLEQVSPNRDVPAMQAADLVAKMKLAPLLDKQLIKLSHGETKRLLLAAALLRQPGILLLLNPFTGLDTETRTELRELIGQVAETGLTVILTTSPFEIPDAVTHVAFFAKDGAIKTYRKEAFQATSYAFPVEPGFDKDILQSLLSTSSMPSFHDFIVMKNVRIQYGEKLILDGINWTIQQGERWALSGPNGAGKSTLLSLINGDNPQAFANDIVLFDRKKGSGESIWDIKRKIGFFSPELYQYFPLDTSCLQAVESGFYDTIGLFRQSNPQLAFLARQWMKLFGIEALSGKLLRQVSAVDQRLCLLARAFVKTPPLLILDEPCQGFSEPQVAAFKALLNAICETGNTTLIYVTHYKEEIPDCVTHFFHLENGKRVH